ncbi:AAA family ATPase [Alkalihalobacillus sp. CinArs1]|uniref:AAA family ATPase n=1 Tax=Alkalihalobacillus sp. CinArs1 TaxID=2995314 RepID=UPI0022DDFC4A|nr:AAA family ATPase [Alkalihalobacillus sp. CinArs1]
MKFVLIFGPQAVGKMTVGAELAKLTGLKLFHNHMTIDPLAPLFGFSSEMWRLSSLFREEIFKTFARSEQYGMIFTYVWAFDEKKDWDSVEKMCTIFTSEGAELYFVELEANVEERLKRNRTPYRLEQKPTKRNIEQSEHNLLETLKTNRLNSYEGEIDQQHYLRINNENLKPEEVARMIKERFML